MVDPSGYCSTYKYYTLNMTVLYCSQQYKITYNNMMASVTLSLYSVELNVTDTFLFTKRYDNLITLNGLARATVVHL